MILKMKKSQFYPLISKVQGLVEKRTALNTLLNVHIQVRVKEKNSTFSSTGEKLSQTLTQRFEEKKKEEIAENEALSQSENFSFEGELSKEEMEKISKTLVPGTLRMFATNLEVGLTGEIPVEASHSQNWAINAKSLFEIMRELSQEDVIFSSYDNHSVHVYQGKSFFHLSGIPPETFPQPPSFDQYSFVSISPKTLKKMIDGTFYCVPNDETRRYLNGLLLEKMSEEESEEEKGELLEKERGGAELDSRDNVKNVLKGLGGGNQTQEAGKLYPLYRMVAMNPYRLSFIEKNLEKDLLEHFPSGVIIPRKGVLEMSLFLDEALREEALIDICVDGNLLIIRFKKSFLMIHLVNDHYPNYRLLIPEEEGENKELSIDREQFLSSLRRVSVLCHQDSRFISLSISKGKLEIRSGKNELGRAREEIDVCYEEEDVELGFNVNYMIEALRSIQAEIVSFHFKDSSSPGIIQPHGDSSQTCVIMPMNLPQF